MYRAMLFILLLALPCQLLAGVKSKLFFAGGAVAVHAALKSPKVRQEIIEQTVGNPALKKKATDILATFIKDPKNAKHIDAAKSFYREIIGIPKKINGRLPINSEYAGKVFHLKGPLSSKYPHGIPFNTQGFPDFSRYVIKKVDIKPTKSRVADFIIADKKANITRKYRAENKLTWHHHENGTTMQLIKTELHEAVRHTGGFAK